MKNRRYSGEDHHFWPFTFSKSRNWRPIGVILDSGAYDGSGGDCHITFSAFGYSLICELPKLVPDYRERHYPATWDAATVARLGRNWYEDVFPREYGFRYTEGTLHLHFGPQTHDSTTTKSKCIFLPWQNWRFIRLSLYDLSGKHFWTERENERAAWEAGQAVERACPKERFEFDDYDGKRIVATTHIEEREWRFGTGWFRWLSWFRPARVSRYLEIEFNAEVGPEKGSWKGGTIGSSIEMLPGELHGAAFRRYCEREHRSKYKPFHVRYVGRVPPEPVTDSDLPPAACDSAVQP
jgi:hypothetical protein